MNAAPLESAQPLLHGVLVLHRLGHVNLGWGDPVLVELLQSRLERVTVGRRRGLGVGRQLDTLHDTASPHQEALREHFLLNRNEPFKLASNAVAKLTAEQTMIRGRSPMTHVQEEKMDSQAMANILIRGAYDKKGDAVAAEIPSALGKLPADAPRNRLGLAKWILSDANPLTTRVTVNRMWQELFGTGLVKTSEDFGIMGSLPSHPELLDWLAIDFRAHGWDVKRFYKQLLTSATYRQSQQQPSTSILK